MCNGGDSLHWHKKGCPQGQHIKDKRIHWHCALPSCLIIAETLPFEIICGRGEYLHAIWRPLDHRGHRHSPLDAFRTKQIQPTALSWYSNHTSGSEWAVSVFSKSNLRGCSFIVCSRDWIAAAESMDLCASSCNHLRILCYYDRRGGDLFEGTISR